MTLLRLNDVEVGFGAQPRRVQAVRGVSLTVDAGETLALVGESGSGKSTLARIAMRLLEPDAGKVHYGDRDVTLLTGNALRAIRCKVQMVFQDPFASLDPRMTVLQSVAEPLHIHRLGSGGERRDRAREMLRKVGLTDDLDAKVPQTLSGGQLQRVAIARALVLSPSVLVCDEPVSALDLSVQAQVLNLLQDIQQDRRVGLLFITHDLSVVSEIADRVAVIYLGRIVESGSRAQVLGSPRHPYTTALLSAASGAWKPTTAPIILKGDPPSPANPPSGCGFRERCWRATEVCARLAPQLTASGAGEHMAACHHPD